MGRTVNGRPTSELWLVHAKGMPSHARETFATCVA